MREGTDWRHGYGYDRAYATIGRSGLQIEVGGRKFEPSRKENEAAGKELEPSRKNTKAAGKEVGR